MTFGDDEKSGLSADDLAEIEVEDADDGDEGEKEPEKKPEAVEKQANDDKKDVKSEDPAKTDNSDEKQEKKSYWPEDWREQAARHYSAGNEKAYKRELRRLQNITDPSGLYGMYRELEGKFTGGGLLKIPGKDAKPEEVAAFHKALGVPDKPEDYLKSVQLPNGVVIGDADKPIIEGFANAVHGSGATPAFVNAALNWYYKQQEEKAADLDEADDKFKRESVASLKEEFGASYRRKTAAIASLFAQAPGGTNLKNENGLFSRLLGGRFADGRIIGNDPDMVRFLVNLASEINPSAMVTEDGDQSGKSVNDEIAEIEKILRTDRRLYDQKYATRYAELLTAREKIQNRQKRS